MFQANQNIMFKKYRISSWFKIVTFECKNLRLRRKVIKNLVGQSKHKGGFQDSHGSERWEDIYHQMKDLEFMMTRLPKQEGKATIDVIGQELSLLLEAYRYHLELQLTVVQYPTSVGKLD